jgi:hypothetical protein
MHRSSLVIGSAGWRIAAIGLLCAIRFSSAHAVVLNDTVSLVAATPTAAQAALAPQTFVVTTGGMYTVTVTDLNLPVALSSLSVAIASSTDLAANLGAVGSSVANPVALAANTTYTVQPLATAAAGSTGAFSVVVTAVGGANPIFQNQWPVTASGSVLPPGESTLSTQFTPTIGGTYQVTLSDRAFPATLSSLQVDILQGATPVCATPINLANPTCQVQLAAGTTYDLFVVGQAGGAALAGLYSLNISAGGAVAYAATTPVGTLPAGLPFNVPSNEMVSVQLADLSFPAALPTLQAVVAQGSAVLQQYAAAATGSISASASPPPVLVYVFAQPAAATGEGSYAVYANDGAGTLLDTAQPVVDSTHYGFSFTTTVAAAALQLSATDFEFPAQFSALSAVAEQQGRMAANTTVNTDFNSNAGIINLVAFAVPAAQTPIGLFRVSLFTQADNSVVYSATQGVGGLFLTIPVAVPAAGDYKLQATDLGFPASLTNLAVVVTDNVGISGEVFGNGSVTLNVSAPAPYVISVVAQVGAGESYGLYGLYLATAPPLPTVSLSASPSSITTGQSVTLTWSSTNATGCTAEGTGAWSGSLATSGMLNVGAVNAATTYTLNCNGPGGVGTMSVQVTILPPTLGGGSGTVGLPTLLLLALSVVGVARCRVTRRSGPGARSRS